MSQNEDILKDMLNRALLPENEKPDKLAVEILSTLIRNSEDTFVDFAKKEILKEIQSTDEKRAIKAIYVLKECFEKSGQLFQKEIAKYRFLNDLIRMVSKKYLGHVTPKELQNEILNFLNFCSIQYPNYKHFEESYNLLKNEDFQMIPAPQVEPRPNFFPDKADEIKFKKLLKSTNKEDVKKANLYLKHFYEKEQQKAELKMRTTEELREYEETVKLLNDMLASNTHEFAYGKVVVASQSETPFDLIKELYERCVKYQTILKQMPTIIDCSDGALMVLRNFRNQVKAYPTYFKNTFSFKKIYLKA